jgi:hypothetical protein
VKKLKLDVEGVRVDSFDTAAVREERGTVEAHITAAVSCYDSRCCTPDYACPPTYYTGPCECDTSQFTCALYPSCAWSCQYDACN